MRMNKWVLSRFLTLVICLTTSAFAQTSVPQNILWRVVVGSADRMTTISPIERDSYPLEGQIFYVPRDNIAGTRPLYRLFNGWDHMDSIGTNEGGYNLEGPSGYPWTSQSATPGLSQLIRDLNTSNGDHALRNSGETLPGTLDEPMAIYGYQRFNNTAELLLSITDGGVTIQSNGVAGGSIWRWTWNGVQFVNTQDYGREIQSALHFQAGIGNPTEAGDAHSDVTISTARRHGSPLLTASNFGSTQTTRAIPLEWNADSLGGDLDHPVVWEDIVIGKDITLNFNGMGPVVKYTSVLTLPSPLTTAALEIPTGYLRATFNRYWTYNAQTETLIDVTSQVPTCNSTGFPFTVNFGGVIISDSSEAAAMGVYGANVSQGGSVNFFRLFNFLCKGDGIGESSFDTSKWAAVRGDGVSFPGGTSTYNSYIITDTVINVVFKMRQLFLAGVK